MELENVESASGGDHWYISDLNLTLQFHNHGSVVIAILVFSIIVLVTIFFFYFIRQYRQFSSSVTVAGSSSTIAANSAAAGESGTQNANNINNIINKGLDEATINSLPVFLHSSTTRGGSSSNSVEEANIITNGGGNNNVVIVNRAYSKNNECSICLGLFEENERVKVIPGCMHVFHCECVDKWLHTHASCPLCRSNLFPPPPPPPPPPSSSPSIPVALQLNAAGA